MIKLRAVLEMFTKGTDKAQKEVGGINKQLDQAANNAARMNKNLAQTQVGQGAMARAGVPDVSDTRTYRTQRGVTGARGASGRDFAAMAQSGGGTGIVAAYAEVASTLFAVTAGFMALSNAAKVDQITKGLEIMGATAGVTLTNVSKGLQQVTGFGITAAESMRTVALATSAGFSKDEIENLGKVAKGSSIALGRDLGDSMDRLIKGAVKLEPELLDELGIMVRLDDAARDYALANNKTVSSLTQLEKRQAFVNAVTAEGLKKFGDLADSANVNPYDKLAASVKELGTDILSFVNNGLKPFVELLANVPALALLPFTYLLQTVSAKLLPTFDSAMEKAGATSEIYARKLTVIRDRSDEITGSMTAANDSLVAQGKAFSNLKAQPGMANRKSEIIGPGLVSSGLSGITEKQLIKAIDEEILSIKQKLITAEGAHATKLTGQRDTLVSIKQKLKEIKNEHKELLRIRNQEIAAQAQLNAQTAQQGILTEFNSNVFSKGLIGATLTGLGDIYADILVPGMKDSDKVSKNLNGTLTGTAIKLKTVGIAAVTAGRLIGMAFLQAIPIIGQLVMVGTIIFSIFAAFESEASKQKKKLLENLKSINENAKEVEKQIDKAFARRDYGAGFQAAINSLSEIVAALKEIEDLSDKAGKKIERAISGSSWLQPKWLADLTGKAALGGPVQLDISKEEASAVTNAISRIADIKGSEYADKVYTKVIAAGKEYLPILLEEEKSVKALANSWSAVGEEASNAAKTLKKLYGKPITETDYTSVISSLINIQRESQAITLAFEEAEVDSTTALAGLYSNIAKGGAEFSAELDRINQDSSYSFQKTFNQYEALGSKIRAMQAAKASETAVQEVINEQNLLAVEAVQKLLQGELLIKGKIRDTEQFILDRRKATLELTKKQNDLEKSIAQKVSDIAKNSRDIQRLRSLGTTEVSSATALQDELDNAKEKARIENIGYSTRASLIALEFELEALKLERAQLSLESAVNTITAFNSGANKVGAEIASEVFKELGKDKSFGNFAKVMKNKVFLDSARLDEEGNATIVDFTPEQINSLWDYATGLDYTARSKEALTIISGLQTTLLDLETESNQSAVDAIKAKIEAYNNIFNVEQRRINQSKIAIEQEEKMIAVQRESEDLYTSVLRARADTKLLKEGQKITSRTSLSREIEDESKKLERLKEDRITQTKKAFEENRQLTLKVDELIEEYIIAKLNPETDLVILQQLSDQIRAADTARANATNTSTAILFKFDNQIVTTEASIARLGASATDLSTIIRDAKVKAQDNLGIARAGVGMSLLGAGDTFRSLIEAEGQEREGGIAAVLADPEAMSKIRAASTEIEFMNIQAEGLSSIFANVRTGIEGAFMAMIDGSKSAKEAFGEMAAAIIKDIAAMIIKMLVFKTIEMGLNFLMPGLGTGVSAGSNIATRAVHATPGSNPRPYANGGLIALANGGIMDARGGLQGIVSKPTYLVGEGRYNEAVVPLPNGKSIPVQMHGGSTQSNNVAVNVNISNSGQVQTETQGQDMGNLGQAIAVAVQKELIAQKMPGGILNRYGAA